QLRFAPLPPWRRKLFGRPGTLPDGPLHARGRGRHSSVAPVLEARIDGQSRRLLDSQVREHGLKHQQGFSARGIALTATPASRFTSTPLPYQASAVSSAARSGRRFPATSASRPKASAFRATTITS